MQSISTGYQLIIDSDRAAHKAALARHLADERRRDRIAFAGELLFGVACVALTWWVQR